MAYAIFKTGGKQYKVQAGDKIDIEKIDVEIGGEASFAEVLLIGDGASTKIGDPVIEGASVVAKVIDQHRAKKVTAFKFKRRKGHHKTRGHRQLLTRLEIQSISA